jgi:hypothetical protein
MIQYFVQQFVRGLKPDIRGAVQSQDPDTIEKALHLASIQENIVSRNKFKPTKPAPLTRPFPSAVKDSKQPQQDSELWKARQARNYKKTNNLCYYCG